MPKKSCLRQPSTQFCHNLEENRQVQRPNQNYHTSLYTDTLNLELSEFRLPNPTAIAGNVQFDERILRTNSIEATNINCDKFNEYYQGGGAFQGFENDILRTISSSTDGSERVLLKHDPVRASTRSNKVFKSQKRRRAADTQASYSTLGSNHGSLRGYRSKSSISSKNEIYGSLNNHRGILNSSFASSDNSFCRSISSNSFDSQSKLLSLRNRVKQVTIQKRKVKINLIIR